MRTQVPSLASLSGLRIRHCGAGCRCGLDPELLWLQCRSAVVALSRPLAWEAVDTALKRQKKKKKKKIEVCSSVNALLIKSTWEFIRKGKCWFLTQTYQIRNSGDGAQKSYSNKIFKWCPWTGSLGTALRLTGSHYFILWRNPGGSEPIQGHSSFLSKPLILWLSYFGQDGGSEAI